MAFEADRKPDRAPRDDRPRRQRTHRATVVMWVAIAFAGGAFIVVLMCCGGPVSLIWVGSRIISAEVESQLRDNPHLQDEIGTLQSFKMDYAQTVSENDEDITVFQVKGTEGAGTLIVTSQDDSAGNTIVISAMLRKADGTERELFPE